jgi:hypothetical protein
LFRRRCVLQVPFFNYFFRVGEFFFVLKKKKNAVRALPLQPQFQKFELFLGLNLTGRFLTFKNPPTPRKFWFGVFAALVAFWIAARLSTFYERAAFSDAIEGRNDYR